MNNLINSTLATSLLAGLLIAPAISADDDMDGVGNNIDNCLTFVNSDQRDTDGDGFGNVCDPDLDQSGGVNFGDLAQLKSVFQVLPADPNADFNGDGFVNFGDLARMKQLFFNGATPGPGPAGPFSNVTYTADAQPIYFDKCSACHTGLGIGGHDIGTVYADAFQNAEDDNCAALNVGQCTIVLIQNGDMPQGMGCTGVPAQDVGNAACLTQNEQDTIQAWIDRGLPQ